MVYFRCLIEILFENLKLMFFPEYDKLVEKTNLEKVESHIGYVAGKEYNSPVGFFKKSILDYLERI